MKDYQSGLMSSDDYAEAIATDPSGNIYVTGGSNSDTSYDYVTLKYNSSGVEQWVARYNGTGNADDLPTAIATDRLGNVYVTGYSITSDSSSAYATVKYDSSGIEQWVALYHGPRNADDYATAMAIDSAGNVLVTGGSVVSNVLHDYATVKYSPSGTEVWVARYDGPGTADDVAVAIAVDDSGNVCVTGFSYAPATGFDYATVKYDSSGAQVWVARYDGPAHNEDDAVAVATDDLGNIYVTGRSTGSGMSSDYATVKYSASGAEQWVSRYDGPGGFDDFPTAVAVDRSGSVYVTGGSGGSSTSFDYATVRYSSSGVQQWVARYNGPGNDYDRATAIAIDNAGKVYVTGVSIGSGTFADCATMMYDSSGVEQWVARYNGQENSQDYGVAIAVDGSGSASVTGSSIGPGTSLDFATVKYDPSGVQEWAARFDLPGNSADVAHAMAIDNSGNVYVTGESAASGTSLDYATVKFSPSGVREWVARYNGPGNDEDRAAAVAMDGAGNVYVTGQSTGSGTWSDYATVKYDPAGAQQWVARYDGAGSPDYPNAISVDRSANVYVTGSSWHPGTSDDFATVKYNSSGEQQWVARYDGPAGGDDNPRAITVDGLGNVYVTGGSPGPVTSYDITTVKYNSSGVEQWVARYDQSGNPDWANAIAVDAAGNVYVTGYTTGAGEAPDFATLKYDSSGIQKWISHYDGPGNRVDNAAALAIDASGSIYVAGASDGLGISHDYATVKYSPSGAEQWVSRYDGPGNNDDHPTSIAIDSSGNVYVTGQSLGAGTGYDCATVKYNSVGEEQWVNRFNATGYSNDGAVAMAVDGPGNVYIAGSTDLDRGSHYLAIKYGQTDLGYPYRRNWNLVSLPRGVANPSRTLIFPTSTSSLFEYNGEYVHRESLLVGKGYWVRLPADGCYPIQGYALTTDSIDVDAGWNVIGSVTQPVMVASILSDPPGMVASRFFGYTGTYVPVSVIEPGQGYWVKVNQNGRLILSSSAAATTQGRITISATSELPPAPPPEGETQDGKGDIPHEFSLGQNYPNPFNPLTRIAYGLPRTEWASLKVFDVLGREVTTLVHERQSAGRYEIAFDGSRLPSGMYFYRLQAGSFTDTKKLLLVR